MDELERRIIPVEWPLDMLAKHLLEYGDNVKLCIHCKHLIEKDGIAQCYANDLSLEGYVLERTACRYFKHVEKNKA